MSINEKLDINEKIENLCEEDREKFQKNLTCVLGDDHSLSLRGVDDSNYDEETIKTILYQEMFEGDFSHLY
ncbi:hypothetical protein KAT24_00050 [Candidatus Pacearchaeota archaeon]|nr:hypothetical protein [Candidatus Pacearchaeota archaeon]